MYFVMTVVLEKEMFPQLWHCILLCKIVAYILLNLLDYYLNADYLRQSSPLLSSHTTSIFKKKEQDGESTDQFHLKVKQLCMK